MPHTPPPFFIKLRKLLAPLALSITVLCLGAVHIESFLFPYALAAYSSSYLSRFNIAAVGDFDCTSKTIENMDNIIQLDPELVIALGDLSYRDTADCWFDIVDPVDEKMKIVIGNHEVESSSKLNQYMNHFNLTEQYYSFNYQNVHFVMLSDYLPYEIGSEQYDFVNSDLQNAAADPEVDWIIVSHHNHAYASEEDSVGGFATSWIETYHPLFRDNGVDLVLQGHQHNYQRTYPLEYNNDEPINPIIAGNSTGYFDPDGQIFVTVGTGGAALHEPLGKAFYTDTLYIGWGILNIVILNYDVAGARQQGEQGQTTKLIGTFYTYDLEKIDEFTIEKSRARS